MRSRTSTVVLPAALFVLSIIVSCATAHAQSGRMLWSHEIGGQFWAPLLHHEGILFFGTDDSVFYAFDIESQQIQWTFETGGIIRSGAAIGGATVFFASDDGFLYALEADSGNELWRFDLGSSKIARVLPATDPPYEYDYLHSSPVIHEGTVYIGSADGALYAIDPATGQERWCFETEGMVRSSPVVDAGSVYFGSRDGHVYAVDAYSGTLEWRFDTGGIVQGSPAVGAGKVFVGSRSAAVFALDAQTGELEWRHVNEDGSWVESSPIFRDGTVYIGSSDALTLYALDAQTGDTTWEFRTGGWSWSTPLVTDEAVYIGGLSASPYYFEGVVLKAGFYAVDRGTGEGAWEFTPQPIEGYITGGVFSTPVVVDGVVYMGALDGRLSAFEE
jgi:outer membrane protein assembly factor BamB